MRFLDKPKSRLKFCLFLLLAALMSALLSQSVSVSLARPLGTIRKGAGAGINDASPTITNTTISNNEQDAIFITSTPTPELEPIVESTFDADDEGWKVFGDAQGDSDQPDYFPKGGNPSGYISATDDGLNETWFWKASAQFLGDFSVAYNGTLTFDLKQSSTSRPFDEDDIILTGGGLTLIFDTPYNPDTEWTAYTIPLNESAGWTKEGTDEIPTQTEMQTVLSSLSELLIRGEYRTGSDTGDLDNVAINRIPDVIPTPTATPTTTSTPTPTAPPATSTPTATATPATSTPTPTPLSGFRVTAITPNEGMTTETTDVTITGNGFVAESSAQLRNADGSHNLLNISYIDATQLLATVPAKLPPGLYDLYVINPDGQSAPLINAFTVLATEPAIVEVRPNQGVADLPNEITIYGFGFAIGASVKLDDTELTTTRINGTQLRAVVPAGLDAGSYTVIVTNPEGQQAPLANGYTVFGDDSNNDLFGYAYDLWLNPSVPRAGEEAQIGLIVHRQGGRNALANVRVRFFRDSQDGTELGDGTIPFLDPPNDEDSTVPLDVTFPEAGTFELVAVIDPDNEVAEDTLGEMNNVISRTVTIGDPAADQTVPVVNDILIDNGASQTTNQNVSVDLRASDPNPNPSGMQAVNIIEYEYNIGASQWIPVQQSNWLPYETTPDNYPWQLQPSAGMRYLQVRAIDNASNISIGHARALISYEPESDMVARRQTRVYRYEVAEGQQLEAVVEVTSGDPDLYVWSENPAESARVSNQASGNEQVIVSADEIVPGIYQIEVYGYSEAQYRLQVTVGSPTTESITHHLPRVSNGPKPLPSEPIVPVSSMPDEQQGVPPAPPTSPPSESEYLLYLPAITR